MNQVPSIVVGAGLRAGEYVLDEKIGQGAFGEVWRAHHRAWTDQFAAVKIPTDPEYLRQLQSEGFSLHRLNHPNIVRIIGFDPAAAPPYLMMELVNGPSLRQVLDKGKLSVPQAVAICRQILAGLAYAHQRGVVHGDLKPENVLVEQEALHAGMQTPGGVKLVDFGVGLVTVAATLGTGGSSRLLRSDRNAAVGTLAYIAPEQREGTAADALCDIFACGVILFELLTGERPAGAEAPSELNHDVPKALDEIFRRAYARRDRRYPSAQEFLSALETVAGTSAAAPRAISPAPAPAEDDIIGFRPDDDEPPESAPQPLAMEDFDPSPTQSPPPEQSAAPAAPQPAAPPHNPAAKTSARGVVVIDEMARKPLRLVNDLRALLRKIYVMRELDSGEIANLRLRLDQWAESVGGLPGFGDRVDILQALDCPYHRVAVTTRFQTEGEAPTDVQGAVMLANPAAAQDCGRALEADDFVPIVHLSTGGAFPVTVLEMIGVPAIRGAVYNLVTAAKTQAAGRPVVRQELTLARANVLSMRYKFESTQQGVCFAGNTLKVVAPSTPVTRMRDDLLKRAASLLDTENIGAGISELQTMFQTSNPAQPRAERMLVALRAKLSAAYVALAREAANGFGVFESLTYCIRADDLLPGSDPAAEHLKRIGKLSFWMQTGPGIMIGLIFGLIAALTRPFSYGYLAAALGAAAAGLVIWHQLRNRPARTYIAFCHGCVVPLALAAILAIGLTRLTPIQAAFFCVILLAAVLFVDRMIFRKYHDWLLRPAYHEPLGGAPADVLNQIQAMLEQDWEKLRPFYLAMDPLYKHASAQIGESAPLAAEPSPEQEPSELDLSQE